MKRQVSSTRVLLALAAMTTAMGCDRAPVDTENPDDLNSLLEDGELDLPRRAALTIAAGGATGTAGTGGPADPGGAGGAGGSVTDPASPPTGPSGPPSTSPVPPPTDARPGPMPGRDAGVPDAGFTEGGSGSGGRSGRGGSGGFADGGFGGAGGRGSRPDSGVPFCPFDPRMFPPGFPLPPGFEGCMQPPLGDWQMDDCNPSRTELRDSSFNNFVAFRTIGVSCVDGVEGRGVSLPAKTDLVYVPDQPRFTFQSGATVAAWVKPTRQVGNQTIFRKREGNSSSVALMQVGRWVIFVINRVGADPAAVTAVLKAGQFHHVAGTYDNKTLRLYVNGQEVATAYAEGRIEDGEGPLLIGNDGNKRRFEGTIDKVLFDTKALTAESIAQLQCLRHPPAVTVSPVKSEPVQPGTPVTYELTITNKDTAACSASSFQVFQEQFDQSFTFSPSFQSLFLETGQTAKAGVTVTSSFDLDSGEFPLRWQVSSFNGRNSNQSVASAIYVVNATGCRVSTRKELIVTDLSVVDDPVRTRFGAPSDDPRRGVWTFKHLMEQIAGSPEQAARMTEDVFRTFTVPQTINGFRVEPRFGMDPQILQPWPRKDGLLDLEQAPLQLLAIVNRLDLRELSKGHGGEGRFVFGMLGQGGFPLEATVIFEFSLPASSEADITGWAQDWHALGALPFPSEEYNAALSVLTARFAGRGVMPGRPAGSALNAFRTNEISFGGQWELREFTLDRAGVLQPDTIKLTPDFSFDRSPELAEWINANEAAVVREKHEVPLTLDGLPGGRAFVGGAVFNNLDTWRIPGVTNPEARHKFALNTCNGCHSSAETGTAFLMVSNRFPGEPARLSPFMTGIVLPDPETGVFRALNDLGRRNRDMVELVCPPDQIPPLPPPPVLPPPLPPFPPPFSDGGFPPGPADGGIGTDGGVSAPPTGPRPPMPGVTPPPSTPVPPTPNAAPTSVSEGIGREH